MVDLHAFLFDLLLANSVAGIDLFLSPALRTTSYVDNTQLRSDDSFELDGTGLQKKD
jgi:hypothetical protein